MLDRSEKNYYFHLREINASLAIRRMGSKYAVGIAYCCPKDQFSRKIGRTIATGRMVRSAVSSSNADTHFICSDIGDIAQRAYLKFRSICSIRREGYRLLSDWEDYIKEVSDMIQNVLEKKTSTKNREDESNFSR